MTLAPGSVLGILGGGQLGRMLAIAAARLGLETHVFAQRDDEPAVAVTGAVTLGAFDDAVALDRFAAAVDVVTLEFENVPAASVERLARAVPVRPGARVLAVTQDRLAEKRLARELGFATADFADVDDALLADAASVRYPARLKTRRLGYDGKGQARVRNAEEARAAWEAMGRAAAVLESEVRFRRELSVIVARRPSGATAVFPLAENRHADGILRETLAPAPASAGLVASANAIAERLAEALDLAGLLAVELFETEDGSLLVNELAPRPHNSGHWTIEGCLPDQFEQAVRAACDWPLGTPVVVDGRWRMLNLIGDDVASAPGFLKQPGARLHLYGKRETRPGRKMGHVTLREPTS